MQYGYLAIFVVLLSAGLGVPIPEDIPLLTGGWLCYRGAMEVVPTIMISMVGVMVGDSLIFLGGRKAGGAVETRPFLRKHFGGRRKAKVEGYFQRWGNLTIFFGRFLAGLRAPTFFTAGVSGMRFRTFFAYDLAAALISVPLLILLAWTFGHQIDQLIGVVTEAKKWLLIAVAAVVVVLVTRLYLRRRAGSSPRPEPPAPESPPPG
jgi:membrane protein DedA with SNARE-associated domain